MIMIGTGELEQSFWKFSYICGIRVCENCQRKDNGICIEVLMRVVYCDGCFRNEKWKCRRNRFCVSVERNIGGRMCLRFQFCLSSLLRVRRFESYEVLSTFRVIEVRILLRFRDTRIGKSLWSGLTSSSRWLKNSLEFRGYILSFSLRVSQGIWSDVKKCIKIWFCLSSKENWNMRVLVACE